MTSKPAQRSNAAVPLMWRYAATGTNQIVAVSGAQIAQAAVEYAGDLVRTTLLRLTEQEPSPGPRCARTEIWWRGWLRSSEFRDGCPVTTTLLELAPAGRRVTDAGWRAFDAWTGVLEHALIAAGAPGARARRLAALAVALEGALVVARVQQDAAPVLDPVADIAVLFDAAPGTLDRPR